MWNYIFRNCKCLTDRITVSLIKTLTIKMLHIFNFKVDFVHYTNYIHKFSQVFCDLPDTRIDRERFQFSVWGAQEVFQDAFAKEFSRYKDDKKRKDPIADFMVCLPLVFTKFALISIAPKSILYIQIVCLTVGPTVSLIHSQIFWIRPPADPPNQV